MQYHRFSSQWSPLFFLLVLVFCVQYSSALVSKAELPKELEDCYRSYSRWSLREVVGEAVCWSCEAPTIHRLQKSKPPEESPSAKAYVDHLMDKLNNIINGKRFKRQATPRCIRKEYRMLTDTERNRFHDALKTLKRDTSVTPNRYDILARIHSGDVIASAHFGPNFLGWHRVYLLLMEAELQEVDPSICLPYWDSSLDERLDNRASSYIFSNQFLGNPSGPVLTGPFAGWEVPGDGPLDRNNAPDTELFSERGIRNILSQTSHREVTRPEGNLRNTIENHHNRVHIFIGGKMNNLERAAHDPAFFLHHCFVDYVWELFRTRQRGLEPPIDPQMDYPWPVVPELPLHAPGRQMGFNVSITNIQGYSDILTSTYQYDPSPICPSCGGTRYLLCDTRIQRCIPVNPNVPRAAQLASADQDSSLSRGSEPIEMQNTFCVDDVCDTREWVYVPVQVVSVRSPDVQTYKSYPFYNGSIWRGNDIYQPSAYRSTSSYIPSRHPKGYEKCHGNGIGQIFIQAKGLSYDGFYKESVIIDQRLATSLAVGYLAVKDPKNGPVKTLFRAFDSCGRLCHTSFKTPGTKRYEAFSGVLDISAVPGQPRQYSHTYGQATLNTWGYSSNQDCPSFVDDDIVFTFYCDYTEEIPWINKKVPAPKPDSPSLRSTAVSKTDECKIDAGCTIDISCDTVNHPALCVGERYKCRETCNEYVECQDRHFWKKCCPYGWSYSIWTQQCTSRQLCLSS